MPGDSIIATEDTCAKLYRLAQVRAQPPALVTAIHDNLYPRFIQSIDASASLVFEGADESCVECLVFRSDLIRGHGIVSCRVICLAHQHWASHAEIRQFVDVKCLGCK